MSFEQPDSDRTSASFEFTAIYAELAELAGRLASTIKAHEIPTYKLTRYELPFSKELYVELPEGIRKYAKPDDITSWYIDFIDESTDENLSVRRAAIELPIASEESSIFLDLPKYDSAMEGKYPILLVRPETITEQMAQKKADETYEPTPGSYKQECIGNISAGDVTNILLRAFGYSTDTIEAQNLSSVDLLSPGRIKELEAAAEVYSQNLTSSASYEVEGIVLNISHEGSDDSGIPDELHLALQETPYSLVISTKKSFVIDIFEDGIKLVKAEDIVLQDLIEQICDITHRLENSASSVELLTDPHHLDSEKSVHPLN